MKIGRSSITPSRSSRSDMALTPSPLGTANTNEVASGPGWSNCALTK